MRILAFSDLHQNKKATARIVAAAKDADLLVGAGDFGNFAAGEEDTIDILAQLDKPILIIPGNHDRPDYLARLCEASASLHYLNKAGATFGDIGFYAIGAEIPSRNDASWNYTISEQEAEDSLSNAPHFDVLVTHTPPEGIADVQRDGSHEGSQSLRQAIDMRQPRLHLCGHIHNSWGAIGESGRCTVHNLGPFVNFYEL